MCCLPCCRPGGGDAACPEAAEAQGGVPAPCCLGRRSSGSDEAFRGAAGRGDSAKRRPEELGKGTPWGGRRWVLEAWQVSQPCSVRASALHSWNHLLVMVEAGRGTSDDFLLPWSLASSPPDQGVEGDKPRLPFGYRVAHGAHHPGVVNA